MFINHHRQKVSTNINSITFYMTYEYFQKPIIMTFPNPANPDHAGLMWQHFGSFLCAKEPNAEDLPLDTNIITSDRAVANV
jgi:hypothetical protein